MITKDIVVQMRANSQKTEDEYTTAREYYENVQAPSAKKNGIEYLVDNLVQDLVKKLHGNLIGFAVDISYAGTGNFKKPLDVLTKAILKESGMNNIGKSKLINNFLVEGLGGLRLGYNPRRRPQFGLGAPVMFVDNPDRVLLDPDVDDEFHITDNIRGRYYRSTLKAAQLKWPDKAEEIASAQSVYEISSISYVDIYELEEKVTRVRINDEDFEEEKDE